MSWILWPNLELLSDTVKYRRFILKAVTGSLPRPSAQHCRCRRSGSGDFGSARRNSTGLYGGEPFCIFYLFLGTGCMIKLQSSMSKHIPVSNVFSVAAILCPLSFPLGLCCKKKKKNQDVIAPSWPSRFFSENHGLVGHEAGLFPPCLWRLTVNLT